MQRRTFLKTTGAAALMPALPMAATPAAATAPATALQLSWATHYARVHNAVSPDLLSSALGFSPDVARGAFQRLLADKVIGPPGAHGIARAAAPFYTSFPGAEPQASQAVAEVTEQGLDRTKDWLPEADPAPAEDNMPDVMEPAEEPVET